MGICLNCNAEIPSEAKFCDLLCNMGYKNRMIKEFEKEFKRTI